MSNAKRSFDGSTSLPTIQSRPSKRQAIEDTNPTDDFNEISQRKEELSLRASFDGAGIQNCGTGNIDIGGNVFIQTPSYPQCLADLRSTDPVVDKLRIESTKGDLLEESYRWVLDNPDFISWRDDPESHLLSVRGPPGKGKTMLLCGIINELKRQSHDITLAFFFCQATDARLNNATAVLRGIIYLLIRQHNHLISHLQQKYEHAGKSLFEDVNAWFALSEILASILQDPSLQNVYIILDALDECEIGRDRLLELVTKINISNRVRWLVSSRNLPDIEEKLNAAPHQVELSLELNQVPVADAVQKYIQYKVEKLARLKKYTPEIRDAVEQYLIGNADDTFLWVALVCQDLAKVQAWRARERIKKFPPGLDSIYYRMMDDVRASDDAELYKQILAVLSVTYRPMTLIEFYQVVDFPADFPDDKELFKELVGFCGSFLTLREDIVYFVHQSAKDFLQTKGANDIYTAGIYQEHIKIYSKSISLMSSTLQRDIYRLRDPSLTRAQIQQLDADPLIALGYFCVHWIDHLCEAISNKNPSTSRSVGIEIINFFKNKYLNWVEALSLLGNVSAGVLSLSKLLGLIQATQVMTESANLVQDALRFMRYHKACIEKYPLQVYHSALVLSPVQSAIREIYSKERPTWINLEPIMEDRWSPCLQTLEGHNSRVNSVACSPNGELLASGSNDGMIGIWKTNTGEISQMFDSGHRSPIASLSYSPDNRFIATGSHDHTVNIWNTTLGTCTGTLEGHRDQVRSIAFSSDGQMLASGSCDSTIMIWHIAATISLARTFECQGGWVNSLAFSPNGRTLAAGSSDYTISILDLTTGASSQILRDHRGPVNAVTFSPESRIVASGSDDQTIKVWDIYTGALARNFTGHDDYVNSIEFSDDGRVLASGSQDHTIKIWDMTTGACLQTLRDHCGSINSVAFLPNGRILASGSNDNTIKIWDTNIGTDTLTYRDHSNWINLLVFSHDGRILASGSDDCTVKVWDAATGRCMHTLSGHKVGIKSIAFSPHGNHTLASGSYDGTIRIWDVDTGSCTQTLHGHTDPVNSIVFLDTFILASASDDHTMKVWDTGTGNPTRTFENYDGSVHSIAFSFDGQMLAWASGCFVQLRDAATVAHFQTLNGHRDVIKCIAFSPDGDRGTIVASGSYDNTIKIWDTATGACVQSLEMGKPIDNLEFESEYLLRTTNGIIDLSGCELDSCLDDIHDAEKPQVSDMPTLGPCYRGLGIDTEGMWITWDNAKVLWLPPEYRPWRSAISGTTVAIGCATGRLLVFGFSSDMII